MNDCQHCVSFIEVNRSKNTNGVEIFYIEIRAVCPVCLYVLKNFEEVKMALKNMYVPKVTELVYKAYTHKVAFYMSVHDLNEMGLTYPLMQK